MKILVTGGAGFMGSNFIRYILNKHPDYEIVNLDKLTYAGNLDNLRDIVNHPHYKFIKGDIADYETVEEAMREKINVIINYAAETHVDRSIFGDKSFVITDVVGTFTLLEAMRHHNVKKYLQISTDEVYGSIEKGKFTEESQLKPSSPYSASKASGDLLCNAFVKTYQSPIIITRSCNFFGPYQYPEKLIPLFVTNLLENKKVPLYGNGSNVREWIYTQDHCSAIDFILDQGEIGQIYNIGTGQEKTNQEVAKMILEELGFNEEMIEYVKDRPGHDLRYALDCSKLKTLGWEPKYKFEEAIKETIAWYKKNDWWWKKIKSGEYLEYYKKQYGK